MRRVVPFVIALAACRAPPPAGGSVIADAAPNAVDPAPIADAGIAGPSIAEGASGASASLPPLDHAQWMEPFEVNGHHASVIIPVGATEPRPLWIGVHGMGDRPEWACGGWRLATGEYPFIVCPRGSPGNGAFTWQSPREIVQSARDIVEAVRARFGKYVADGSLVYAGFSQGGNLASAAVLEASMPPVDAIVFAEGGYGTTADRAVAKRLFEHGVRRAWLVCGQNDCKVSAAEATPALAHAGLDVRTSADVRAGHNLNARMQKIVAGDLAWFVRDDPRWDPWRAAPQTH